MKERKLLHLEHFKTRKGRALDKLLGETAQY